MSFISSAEEAYKVSAHFNWSLHFLTLERFKVTVCRVCRVSLSFRYFLKMKAKIHKLGGPIKIQTVGLYAEILLSLHCNCVPPITPKPSNGRSVKLNVSKETHRGHV